MRTIKVMADYHAKPLWLEPGGGNLDPASLDISRGLVDDLLAWADEYTGTFIDGNPPMFGFASDDAELRFVARGRELAARLSAELGPNSRVTFFYSGKLGRFE